LAAMVCTAPVIVTIVAIVTSASQLRPHSIILASCKPGFKPGFRPGLQPGSRQVRAGLQHAFDFFVENLVANRSRFAVCARARQMA